MSPVSNGIVLNATKFNLHKGGACNAYYVPEIWDSYSGSAEDSGLLGWSCVVGPVLPEVSKVTFTTLDFKLSSCSVCCMLYLG